MITKVDVDKPLGLKLGESTSPFGGVVVKVRTLTVQSPPQAAVPAVQHGHQL